LAGGELFAFGEGSLVGRGQALFEATGLGTNVCGAIECGSFGIEFGEEARRVVHESSGRLSSFSEAGLTAIGTSQETMLSGVL
jgi:hypothetical protein